MAFFFEQWKTKKEDTKEWVTIDGRPVFVGGPSSGGGSGDTIEKTVSITREQANDMGKFLRDSLVDSRGRIETGVVKLNIVPEGADAQQQITMFVKYPDTIGGRMRVSQRAFVKRTEPEDFYDQETATWRDNPNAGKVSSVPVWRFSSYPTVNSQGKLRGKPSSDYQEYEDALLSKVGSIDKGFLE